MSFSKVIKDTVLNSSVAFIVFFLFKNFIAIFILLAHREAMEALLHRLGNYPDLLPEMPRYCCPLVI